MKQLLLLVSGLTLGVSAMTAMGSNCGQLDTAEAFLLPMYVTEKDQTSCNVSSDCVVAAVDGFYCGKIINRETSTQVDAYHQSIVYQTLEDKFGSLNCVHPQPPCLDLGTPTCVSGQCIGVLP